MVVASAMPTCCIEGNSQSEIPILATTDSPAKTVGVTVSLREKKPGCSTRISTKAGRPQAKPTSASATGTVAAASKAPRSNKTRTMGTDSAASAAAAGMASSMESKSD